VFPHWVNRAKVFQTLMKGIAMPSSLTFINPSEITKPASNYSQGVLFPAGGRRLVISGQIGMTPDGKVVTGLEAQLRQTWANLLAVLKAADMAVTDLVKVTSFSTDPKGVGLFRQVRDEMLGGHRPASTYLVVAGLAMPDLLCEIEAEAVKG
jgi:enamine deaminase RidA (YjgF/YER057c/UK114 family)